MNKEEYLRIVDNLKLDKHEYCIIASGSLLMHGLTDSCNDVDIRVSKELFDKLMDKYHMRQSDRYDYVYELSDNIDVNCKNFNKDNIEIVDDYPVEKLEINLEWMITNNRDKDKEKIRIIKEYLENKKSV
ncbi:MAG: hypothetical protein IKP76_03425 [Bacilli bacterium]|nr:hypothetical protein [Bacilli bacterium]